MELVTIAPPCPAAGPSRALSALRFGLEGGRPKACIQASRHADELAGMRVARRLGLQLGDDFPLPSVPSAART